MYDTVIIIPGAGERRGLRRIAGALKAYEESIKKGENPIIIFSGVDRSNYTDFLLNYIKKKGRNF
jgi:hypothetical protein